MLTNEQTKLLSRIEHGRATPQDHGALDALARYAARLPLDDDERDRVERAAQKVSR